MSSQKLLLYWRIEKVHKIPLYFVWIQPTKHLQYSLFFVCSKQIKVENPDKNKMAASHLNILYIWTLHHSCLCQVDPYAFTAVWPMWKIEEFPGYDSLTIKSSPMASRPSPQTEDSSFFTHLEVRNGPWS